MPAATQTRIITIKVDSQDKEKINQMAEAMGQLNKNTKDLASGFGFLKGVTSVWLAGFSVRELAGFSDEIQNLNNRLVGMTGSQQTATDTMKELLQVSQDTNTPLHAVSDAYFRMGTNLRDVGVTQKTVLELTETLANTFRLSGASSTEASNGILELGHAFAFGNLNMREFRSIVNNNIVLSRILRKEFGHDFKAAIEEGLVTAPRLMGILFKHMDEINGQAKTMTTTFEQGLTKALDVFKIKIYEIGQALGASSIFNAGINSVIKNMGYLIAVGTVLAAGTLPALVKGVYSLATAMGVLNLSSLVFTGPWLLLIGILKLTGTSIDEAVNNVEVGLNKTAAFLDDMTAKFLRFMASLTFNKDVEAGWKKSAAALEMDAEDHRRHALALQIEFDAKKKWEEQEKKSADAQARRAADLAKANSAYPLDLDPKKQLAALNKQYLEGRIDVEQYNRAILQTDTNIAQWKFKKGEEDLGKLNDQLRKFQTFGINQQLKNGDISLEEFRKKISEVKLDNLNDDLNAGRISLEEYNKKIASVSEQFSLGGAFRTGLQGYVDDIGTSTQQVANGIKQTFSHLEDAMFDFVKRGKFNFQQFTQAVLDDLTRIIIRSTIIQPLAQGLLGSFGNNAAPAGNSQTYGPGSATLYSSPTGGSAHGNVFDRGLKRFATGGIVTGPTMFGYGNGRRGLMGEAGPEAILPLKRGSGGDLGVQASINPVTVNIINQSGNEVHQKESSGPNGEKVLDVIISGKIKEGFATGKFDKEMRQYFGVSRKGT